MREIRRVFRALSLVLFAVGLLSACDGSHSSTTSVLPALAKQKHAAAVAPATDIVAINAGGAASGSFAADEYFNPASWTYAVSNAITTSGVTNPAPQAVYQNEREGPAISYTIPGLTAGTAYTVKLSFAELWWTAAGKRVFNVSINNAAVLTNFDIFARSGARYAAVAESFTATASSSGTITIALTALTDNAAINAIEISAAGSAPTAAPTATPTASATATPPPSGSVFINSGGSAVGGFVADRDYSASSWTFATTSTVVTSGVTNPAPEAVYQNEREGSTISYTIPGLTAGGTYTVRLDFAELWWTAPGQRIFNVGINGTKVLTNFDVFATAGARFKAVAESFTASPNSAGAIVISFTAVTDNAAISAIEISPGNGSVTPPPGTPTPTPTPTTVPGSKTLVDWPTYGYDAQRSGFNPYTTGITPASIAGLHVAWQIETGGAPTQPIIATNVLAAHPQLLIVASYVTAQAYDALTGALVWQTNLPKQSVQACGTSGISGTVVYDKALGALFMAAGSGGTDPNHVVLFELSAATGSILNRVDVTPSLEPGEANYSHAGISMANGLIYVGTGSDCEGSPSSVYPSWRGRVVAVNPSSMTVQDTFFTTWQVGSQPGNYGGGGVWAWGGVSADTSGNIYVSTGNAETTVATGSLQAQPPFATTTNEQAGYAEHLVKLSGDLSTVEGANYPGFNFAIGYADLDYTGVPVVMLPSATSGCPVLTATQGKGGTLVINNASSLAEVNAFALSVPSASALYVGNPAYSPNTGYLYAAITSSGAGSSMLAPGLAAIGGCGSTLAWHAQFGPDSAAFSGDNMRSALTVTAGGVVFIGTPCASNGSGGCGAGGTADGALWAVDGSSGTVLGGGKPLLITGDNIRMPPTTDGLWVWVYDSSGNLYGLTVDPSVPAAALKRGHRVTPTFRVRD